MNMLRILLLLSFLSSESGASTTDDVARMYQQAKYFREFDPQQALMITDTLLVCGRDEIIPLWKIKELRSKIYLKLRNIDEAMRLAQQADSIYFSLKKEHLIPAYSVLAISHKDKGNLREAHRYYQYVALHTTDTLSRAINLFNLADVATSAGDTSDALYYFTDNLNYIEQKARPLDQAYCFRSYANILQKTSENLDEALRMFKRAVGIYELHQVYEDAGFSCSGVASIYNKLGKPDSCRIWSDRAVAYQEKADSPLGLANAYVGYGRFEFDCGNFNKALFLYKKALAYSYQANYVPVLEQNLKGLSEASERTGDFKSAVDYLKKCRDLLDSVGKWKWLGQLSEMQLKYSVAEKEREIKQLRKLVVRNQIPLLASFTTFIFLCFIAVVIYQGKKKKRKRKKNVYGTHFSADPDPIPREKTKIWAALQQAVNEGKFYPDPDLTLIMLARHLKTNRTTLSEIINANSGRSFNRFINGYRVKEACRLLSDPKKSHLSIEGIAQETGFKSRSAFYAAFVAETGVTPAHYRKNNTV